jgi:hypothetical protein
VLSFALTLESKGIGHNSGHHLPWPDPEYNHILRAPQNLQAPSSCFELPCITTAEDSTSSDANLIVSTVLKGLSSDTSLGFLIVTPLKNLWQIWNQSYLKEQHHSQGF